VGVLCDACPWRNYIAFMLGISHTKSAVTVITPAVVGVPKRP